MPKNVRPDGKFPADGKRRSPITTIKLGTVKRVLSYMAPYKGRLAIVVLCIIMSALASVAGSLFLKTLIDDYIEPLLTVSNPVYTELLRAVLTMALIYLLGIFSTWLYNYLMVGVSQGILKTVRDTMFEKMQRLPIKYFDTHTHGDVMSHYTNDTDTLRQMISQSLPQTFSSLITVFCVFCAMLIQSWILTLFVLAFIAVMIFIAGKIGGQSAHFFIRQQQSLGAVNGYIEEMINGQKVVKVFCHERKSEQDFDKVNDELCRNATEANKFANILMPIMGNLGHLQYALIAVLGGLLAVKSGESIITL
ncbi:MAG: ABC transporter ATP-binding protein, partial [Clostridia bacterium]|nr:ABC transporter ATP-binding protein [Clostridia bacterium]